jgi:hypothetical protein
MLRHLKQRTELKAIDKSAGYAAFEIIYLDSVSYGIPKSIEWKATSSAVHGATAKIILSLVIGQVAALG